MESREIRLPFHAGSKESSAHFNITDLKKIERVPLAICKVDEVGPTHHIAVIGHMKERAVEKSVHSVGIVFELQVDECC